ncbi:MAG: GntR family transcriptional regulator [Eubacterium sp.]|nr:GntR family transcriptional regulator [Eubacterium sp.]
MYKYEKIINWIHEQIERGIYPPGSKLPTEMTLMNRFSVSRQSVRRAIQILEEEELLYSIQGSGIYVREHVKPGRTSGISDVLFQHEIKQPARTNSRQIALVHMEPAEYIFPARISGIYEALENAGYFINLFFTDNRSEKEVQIFRQLLEGDYAGILLDGTQSALPRLDETLFRQVIHKYPTVMMDSRYQGYHLPCVSLDDILGGYLITRHLIEKGHREIAYIGRTEYRQGIKRGQGYAKAMMESGLEVEPRRMIWYTLDTYPLLFKNSLPAPYADILSGCTAIVCYNDQVAYDMIYLLEKQGLRVPEDISVTGYDNATFPDQHRKLTTINHPKKQLGIKVAENLLQLIQNPSFDANYIFKPEVVIGGTVRDLNE